MHSVLKNSLISTSRVDRAIKWLKPDANVYKVNWDAALNVIRKKNGVWNHSKGLAGRGLQLYFLRDW